MTQFSHDNRFYWLEACGWCPVESLQPIKPTAGPLPPEPVRPQHVRGCMCDECWDAGQAFAEYQKAKRIYEMNGF